jgi:hypothetical protein
MYWGFGFFCGAFGISPVSRVSGSVETFQVIFKISRFPGDFPSGPTLFLGREDDIRPGNRGTPHSSSTVKEFQASAC